MANTNIINAVFGSGICTVTTSAFRANYGMVLRFSGIDLPTAFEVDFSNYDVMGRDSITMIGQNNEVQIPDDLWDSGLNIYAYVYLHPTDDSGVTVYTVTIPVLGRPNRTEEEPTPHEQSVIEQAISALNEAVEATAADVETTTANAQAAAQSEANAATSERSAAASAGAALASQNAAESASQSATESASGAAESAESAANSASAAAESATNAQASAAQAERSVQSISGDVERAEQAATTATEKATAASGSAATASAKATEAAQLASSAAAWAANAADLASDAQDYAIDAEQAKTDAQDAQAAAEQAAQSVSGLSAQIAQNTADIADLVQSKAGALIDTATGSIASFTPDSTIPTVRGLTVNVEPQQDLHGYDNPWPAGGGKNLCPPLVPTTGTGLTITANLDGSLSVSGTATASGYITEFATLAQNISSGTAFVISIKSPVSARIRAFFDSGVADIYEGSTSSASITQSDDVTKVRLYLFLTAGTAYNFTIYFQLEKGSTATSWTPYSNICPISGWDEVEVQRTGKNLFGYSLPIHKGYWSSTSYVGDDSVVTLENATGWTNIRVPVPDGATITISGMQAQSGVYAAWLGSDNPADVISRVTNYSMNGTKTVPNGAKYFGLCFSNLSTAYADYPNAQIELGSTATAYTPYQGETYDITFPTEAGTVYGGSLTIAEDGSGVLTVDRANVDLGTLTSSTDNGWKYITNDGTPYFRVYLMRKKPGLNMICSNYKTSTTTGTGSLQDKTIGAGANDTRVYLRDAEYTSLESFITAMSGVQLVYELATPITIDLTPIEISVLTGQTNNIWADSGNVSVEYAADLKTYIDQKIAAAVAALS